jgi:nitric-oxide synthase, bacterial
MSLNEDRILQVSRWRMPGRGRPRERGRGLEPYGESPGFPPLHACPAAGGSGNGFPAQPAGLAAGWPLPGPGADAPGMDHLLASAEQFIAMFYGENHLGSPAPRLRQLRREIDASGTYWHTPGELAFGARVAWRNSSRCIGRLYWRSLRVRDRREVAAGAAIAAESVTHLLEATNGGRVRPVITVFAPDAPGRPGPRILNSQLVSYAGYRAADGAVTGDPANADLTQLARDLGWPGGWPQGRFDILPLLVREPGAPVTVHEIPAGAVLQVPIEHPDFRWFACLGLQWYAVPVISDMYLDIGGIHYPAAPFNGWYMCTEIGARDLGDGGRYDQLPVIAGQMGLSTASDLNLWKDKAMTELNLAVLHSFTAAGVTITDHHTESVRFLQHIAREERHGRECPADWTWIVPPAASSATPVFHRYYKDFEQAPNFYRHPAAVTRQTAVLRGLPEHNGDPAVLRGLREHNGDPAVVRGPGEHNGDPAVVRGPGEHNGDPAVLRGLPAPAGERGAPGGEEGWERVPLPHDPAELLQVQRV